MPMVLFGMAVAILIATLAWNRSWTRRTVSNHADLAWQAQLLAESGTACALQEAMARAGTAKAKDTTAKDSLAKTKIVIRDTADSSCAFHRSPPGEMTWDEPAGTQLLTIHATGTVQESGRPLTNKMRSTWGGNPPLDPFSPAISLWERRTNPLIPPGKRTGSIRVNYSPPSPGTTSQKSGGIEQFVPTSIAADTAAAIDRMARAFRSTDAHMGGESFSSQRPPPDVDSLVYTMGDVVFDAPWAGDTWNPGRPRTIFVEGRVEFRGRLSLRGWTIYAKGPVVVQDEANLTEIGIFSSGGVQIADRARVSGQILSSGRIVVVGDARIGPPSFAACWPGKGRDSLPRFSLENRAVAEVYAVALGGAAEIRIASGAVLRGVAVAGGTLRNDGRIDGLAVAGRLDCGQGDRNCASGSFHRDRLPVDFAYPLGLPGSQGFRLISWGTGE